MLTSDGSGTGTWQPAPGGSGSGDITAVNTAAGSGLQGGTASGDANLSLLTSCGPNQILKWSGSAWNCAADVDSGGAITGVTAGAGLTGGGATGGVTLAADFGGSGAANSVARSDHNHFQQTWSGAFGAGRGLSVINTGSGGFTDGLWARATPPATGAASSGTPRWRRAPNYGVWGQSDSSAGRGVFGLASAGSGVNCGVYGQSNSPAGYAGYFPGRVAVDALDRTAAGTLTIGASTATSVTITPSTSVQGTLTIGGGAAIASVLSATSFLDFGLVPANGCVDAEAITLTGAVPGDSVVLGIPPSSVVANTNYTAWVSASNTVTVSLCNVDTSPSADPASGTFRATVIRF